MISDSHLVRLTTSKGHTIQLVQLIHYVEL